MVDPNDRLVAVPGSWASISSWLLLVPIVMAAVFSGYVIVEVAN
jgi:hypothetical protein